MKRDELMAYVAARTYEDGDCLRWRGYAFNGHPGGSIQGEKFLVRRALYETAHGPIPNGRILRCTCDTSDCVNEDHAKLSTYRAVAKECGAKGLMSGPVRSARIAAVKRAGKQARISQEEARAIRASDEAGVVLAQRYGISEATISKIRRGTVRRDFAGNPWAGLA